MRASLPIRAVTPPSKDGCAEEAQTRSRPGELVAVVLAGVLHIATELLVSRAVAAALNAVLVLVFLGYLIWRAKVEPGVLQAWGMRTDNCGSAARALAKFAIPSAIALYVYGWFAGHTPLPPTFWLTLLLYPAWGIAQQFALQNLIGANLKSYVLSPWLHALVTTSLFSISHFPDWELMALTFAAGFAFTLIWRRHPNLWAVGTAHGFLGALAFYLVLGEDPVTLLRGWLAE